MKHRRKPTRFTLSALWSKPQAKIGMAAIAVIALGLMFALPKAQAGIGLGVAPDFPSTVTVGDTGVPVQLDITNTSSPDEGTITLTSIFLTPQCGATGIPCSQPDPGVLAVSPTGTGSAACTGINFTIAEVDAATGKVQFTPSSTVNLALGAQCDIHFTVDALKTATKDAAPVPAGIQTAQLGEVNAVDSQELPGSGTGTDITTVNKAPSSVVTHIHDASHADITRTSVPVGTVIHDNASVTGVGPAIAGTVDFRLYTNANCNSAFTTEAGVALSGGVAESTPWTPAVGSLGYIAHYNGDANHNPSNGACEPLTVHKLDSTTVTHIHDASHANITGTSVPVGTVIHDNATVSGSGPVPTGTVDFKLFTNANCDSAFTTEAGVTLSGGVAESTPWTPAVGSLGYIAHYNGDATYNPSDGTCEPLTIHKLDSTTVTHVHDAAHADITGTSVPVGTVIHDNATVSGSGPVPTGTVDFKLYANANCTGDFTTEAGVALSGGVAESTPWTPAAGSIGYIAHYNGDGTYNPSTGICEPLTISKLNSNTVTHIHDASHANITGTNVPVGTIIHDNAVVSGTGPVPTGTVDFRLYTNANCDSAFTTEAGVALSGGVAESTPWTPGAGSLGYIAHYNGDATYNPSTGICEPLTVHKLDSSTVTHVHNASHADITGTTVPAGTTIHDNATVSGSGPVPTGTVDFRLYTNANCTGDFTTEAGVALSGGVAESTPWTPAVGSLGYIAHYNGDGTYNPSTGICEPLTVSKLDSSTVTHVHDASHTDITNQTVPVGTMVHDKATVSGSGATPTGTVDFRLFTNATCTGDPSSTEAGVALASGMAESTPWTTTAGSFGYMVHYNGDGTYNPSTGICEPFSVSNPLVTRTLGFWQTHTDFTWKVFTTQLGGSMPIGTAPHKGFITTKAQLFGGFYASIPYKTDGSKRNPIDKARIQLLQQLIAAKLNCAAFGCTASVMAMITNADNAYANGPASAILAAASQLDAYNNSGDGGTIPASLGDPGSATPDASQAVANLAYWDNP